MVYGKGTGVQNTGSCGRLRPMSGTLVIIHNYGGLYSGALCYEISRRQGEGGGGSIIACYGVGGGGPEYSCDKR